MDFRKIIFGIGSNIGDKEANLDKAVKFLKSQLFLEEIKSSGILKNPAMLPENAPKEWDIEFLNIAIIAKIDINKFPPLNILKIVKEIEREIGRKDRGRWSPREIDIDILFIENLEFDDENLKIPHPGLKERDFFIKTVEEIYP